LRLGRTAVNRLQIRAELVGGVVLIAIALSFLVEDLLGRS